MSQVEVTKVEYMIRTGGVQAVEASKIEYMIRMRPGGDAVVPTQQMHVFTQLIVEEA